MKKNIKIMLGATLLAVLIALSSGCSQQRNYGEEYNYETDCQHSYYGNVNLWKKIQSDGAGQYILKNDYIYYYNTENKAMTPLCNKANCLHDMETDKSRRSDCNAYASVGSLKLIQYYDGYIYYFSSFEDGEIFCNTLYRVKKDGSEKDKIFTTDEELDVEDWLIHRGYLYYALKTYYYGEDESTQVYNKCILKSLKLSSKMSEKKAKVIFESDDKHTLISFSRLKAYKNYLCYGITANENDFEITTNESWLKQLYIPMYIYNIETGQNNEIPVPKGYSETTYIGRVAFLEDKMLFSVSDSTVNMHNDMYDLNYKLPIYSINYDLTDEKIWLDDVEQGKLLQTYDDYVVLSDAQIQFFPYLFPEVVSDGDLQTDSSKLCTNVEIYSADAKRVSYFVYPMNVMGNFNGFGPDGVNVEFDEDDNSWSVYELNFKDVLNCHGEEVKLKRVSTRRFGPLNKEDYEGLAEN